MTEDRLADESWALRDYFESLGLSELQACAIMGFTLKMLIAENRDAEVFAELLARLHLGANAVEAIN